MTALESRGSVEPTHDETKGDLPDVLYHYTNQQGLLGIVDSRFIFATKIQYFNDSAEFHLTLDLAKAILHDRITDGLDAELGSRLDDDIEGIRQSNMFAISLSEEPDLLSQWRAYGAPGSSFAIGLDTALIEEIANDIGWSLERCIYSPNDHRRVVGAAVAHAVGANDPGAVLRNLLLAIAPINKHVSFEEEGEWRVFSPPLPEDLSFEIRPGRFTPVPYLRLPLQTQRGETAFREVVVGPTPHRDLSIMAVSCLLRREGLLVPVRASQTTFREW